MSETGDKQSDRFTPDEVIAKQRNRQLFVLSGIIIVLAVLVLITRQFKDDESPLKDVLLAGGMADETSFLKSDVKQIEIWKGPEGQRLTLNRDGEEWRVPGRFNAPADKSDIDALLKQVLESRRLNRASTETEAQFVNYRLDDANAVHLRLTNDKGEELLHVLVGRSETGARDFVRLAGPDAPPGIFELTGAGGSFNTLYSTLNLGSDGEPQARRWISTRGFKPLEFDAVVESVGIKDGESQLVFSRKAGSDETQDEWELTTPHKATANGAEVRSIIDALMNYNAGDIAGRDTDAPKFEFMQTGREITLTTREGSNLRTTRLFFGRTNDDNEVAVWLKADDKGEYIYWAGDFILTRLFRPKSDFLQKQRIEVTPPGAEIESITLADEGTMTELQRERQGAATSWQLLQPWLSPAERTEVSNLLTGLNTLQGYRTEGEADHDALGVTPGIATRVITLRYKPLRAGDDRDGQEEADPAEGTQEEPQPETPKLKTVTLYFGKTQQREVPMLRVSDAGQELYWVNETALSRLFVLPVNYAQPQSIRLVPEGWALEEVRRLKDGKVVQMVQKAVAEDGGKRWMLNEPVEDMANQTEALALVRAIEELAGVAQVELNTEEFKLGESISSRALDLRLVNEGESQIVSVYFGEPKWERTTVFVTRGEERQYFLVSQPDAERLFSIILQDYDVKVRHILISWEGQGVPLKQPGRTKEQAHELAKRLLQRYRDGEDFIELQLEFNEDSMDPTAVFDVTPQANLVEPFKRVSGSLEVNEAGIAESRFGYHVIKRIE